MKRWNTTQTSASPVTAARADAEDRGADDKSGITVPSKTLTGQLYYDANVNHQDTYPKGY